MNIIESTLRTRLTSKVLATGGNALPQTGNLTTHRLDAWVQAAGFAPFHKPAHKIYAGEAKTFEPWRIVKFNDVDCRSLAQELAQRSTEAGKIIDMLNAADGMALVAWLPNPSGGADIEGQDAFEASFDNMEIIAAAGALCQSLLLAAQADGWRSYWSSGGLLRERPTFERYGLPATAILTGAIFFFPPADQAGSSETRVGNMRAKRSSADAWSHWAGDVA